MKSQRLIALFVAGFLLFNYPLMSIFDRDLLFFGVPLQYLYFFIVWAVVIVLVAVVAHSDS